MRVRHCRSLPDLRGASEGRRQGDPVLKGQAYGQTLIVELCDQSEACWLGFDAEAIDQFHICHISFGEAGEAH